MAARELEEIIGRTFYPRNVDVLSNIDETIDRYIVGSYAPKAPPIKDGDLIACIGSCFAAEIGKSLAAQGKKTAPIFLTERWNTAFAVRHCLEFVLEDRPFPPDFLAPGVSFNPGSGGALKQAGAFIITFGLSMAWYTLNGRTMVIDVGAGHTLGGIVKAVTTHTMRQTSVAENVDQIEAVVACIRRVNKTAPIVLTLSPNPLLLALTDYPPIAANTISKATLRIALHEVIERQHEGVFYWPSYEIVEWIGKHVRQIWGQADNDLRHLESSTVDEVMSRFSALYFAK